MFPFDNSILFIHIIGVITRENLEAVVLHWQFLQIYNFTSVDNFFFSPVSQIEKNYNFCRKKTIDAGNKSG